MPINYLVNSDKKLAYIKAWGTVAVEDIIGKAAEMFAEKEWINGFNILCDYREISQFDLAQEDVRKIVKQDQKNRLLMNKSKCAVVSSKDLVYGLSRMWQILSVDTGLTAKVLRNIEDAVDWLEIDLAFIDSIKM